MTDAERERIERDAERDAEALALLLLLKRRDARIEFRADVGRFYVDGKSVSITTIRGYIQRIEARLGKRVSSLADDLAKDRISVGAFQREFERIVTSAHVLAAALAIGSIAAAARNAEVEARLRSELEYADGFVKDLREKPEAMPRAKSRAKSYLMAAAITYGIMERNVRSLLGIYTEARRVRRASESCAGCRAVAGKWMPIDKIPPIGSMECGSRCRCYLEYR